MNNIHIQIEENFAQFGGLIFQYRWLVLIFSILLCLGLGSFLPRMTIDNSNDSYLHADDPTTIVYNKFRSQFGQDEMLLVAIEPPEIFDIQFLEKLRDFHRDIENELPYIAEVTSLLNARQMRGEGDQLIVEDLMEDWPETDEDISELRARVLANPLYIDQFISRNAKLTTVVIRPEIETGEDLADKDAIEGFEDNFDDDFQDDDSDLSSQPGSSSEELPSSSFLSPKKKDEIVTALDKVITRYESPDFQIDVAGGFFFGQRISKMLKEDISAYMLACMLVIVLFLFLLFRRFAGIVLPMVVVFATLVSTFGAMALVGIPFSVTMQLVPVFLMCVCVCNCVHFLVPIYQNMSAGLDKKQAIESAFRHSGLAILMANLTTAAGMGSFIAAELLPVSYLGMVSSIAVMLSFLLSLLIMPALVAIFPVNPPKLSLGNEEETTQGILGRVLVNLGQWAVNKPWLVMGITALLLLVCVVGIMQLKFSHAPIKWFPEDHEVRLGSEMIDEYLGGTRSIEVVVDTGRENGLHDPEILARFEEAITFAGDLQEGPLKVGKEISFLDILKETHQALNGNKPDFYAVPDSRELIAQELLLFENSGSDDLEPLVDSQFSVGRISLRIPRADRIYYAPFLTRLEDGLKQIFKDDVSIYITGVAPLIGQIFYAMIRSMASSYLIAFSIIIPLMMVLIGSFRMGMISMVPNFFPIVFVLGVMGWTGIPLDTSTILIGSILIGLAVDDTIHIMHHFRRYHDKTASVDMAVNRTLRTTGVALLFTTVVLGSGFFAIGANATMYNTIRFGYLTALGIWVAFIADILISPALMKLVYDRKSKPVHVEECQ